jgi:very-long-chain (3R)-3-hydroxyacyl-CoA dehydratase
METNKINTIYIKSHYYLEIVQYGSILEIIHSILKLTPSPFFSTFVQIFSRVGIVYFLQNFKHSRSIGYILLSFAWSITEIIRYPYYLLNILKKEYNKENLIPYWLTWCRYSFFIVLYPLGVSGEILTVYFSKKNLKNIKFFGFRMEYITYIIYIIYIPGIIFLYSYMLKQRKKVLVNKKEKKE